MSELLQAAAQDLLDEVRQHERLYGHTFASAHYLEETLKGHSRLVRFKWDADKGKMDWDEHGDWIHMGWHA